MTGRQLSLNDERQRATFGALDAKEPGSIAWSWHVLEVLKLRWQRVESDYGEFESLLDQAETHQIWEVVPPGSPYGSLDAMLAVELGTPEPEVRRTVREVKLREGRGRPARDGKDNNVMISPPRQGNDRTYTVARLKRDRPELADRVEAGELSANAAAIEAGFRPRTMTIPAESIDSIAAYLRRRLSDEDRQRLAVLLVDAEATDG